LLDVVVAVLEDPLDEIAEARTRRRAGGGELLVEDHVVDARQLVSADVLRPRQAEEAGLVERLVPRGLTAPVVVIGRRRRQSRVVGVEPGPQPGTELGFVR
jgi:hypothetical protein